jgi:hypothetical protein
MNSEVPILFDNIFFYIMIQVTLHLFFPLSAHIKKWPRHSFATSYKLSGVCNVVSMLSEKKECRQVEK